MFLKLFHAYRQMDTANLIGAPQGHKRSKHLSVCLYGWLDVVITSVEEQGLMKLLTSTEQM
jgi:hypothetical protein